MPGHPSLKGLPVLKEALRLMERNYPETMHKIFFYRPTPAFRLIFSIFRLWVPASTRSRFVLVREGDEAKHFFTPIETGGCGLDRQKTPLEFGGRGASLDGDRFLLHACHFYDSKCDTPWSSTRSSPELLGAESRQLLAKGQVL